MAAFVGASTVYGSTSWPTSLSFTASDLPAGTTTGDRLVAFVTVSYSQKLSPPADTTLNGFSGFSDWSTVPQASFAQTFTGAVIWTKIYSFTTRLTSGLLPLTIIPLDPTGATYVPVNYGSYRLTVAAWRPSYGWSGRANASDTDSQTAPVKLSPDDSMSVTGVGSGQFVEATFLAAGDLGSVSTANGFSVQYTQASIAGLGGSFTIADKSFSSTGTTGAIVFNKSNGPAVNLLFALDVEDPALGTGWSVDQIRY